MNQTRFSWERFQQAPLIGIVRSITPDDLRAILPVYVAAGLTTIEITMNTPGAEDLIQYASKHYAGLLNIGAGTVCTNPELADALDAGARFIVTPVLSRPVIQACVKQDIPVFPGAFTPSEIYEAWSLGASLVKVFPATSLGPTYISDLKAPLRQIRLLPTGGITLDNLTDFMKAGADGVGVGSQLFDRTLIRAKDWSGLRAHFQQFVDQLATTIPKN